MDWTLVKLALGVIAGGLMIAFRNPMATAIADTEERLISMVQRRHESQRERKAALGRTWMTLFGALIAGICLLGIIQHLGGQ